MPVATPPRDEVGIDAPHAPIIGIIRIDNFTILVVPQESAALTGKAGMSLGQLTDVIGTFEAVGFFLGLRQGWQEHAGQNADNGNDHQQLDKGKALFDLCFHVFLLVGYFGLCADLQRSLSRPHS